MFLSKILFGYPSARVTPNKLITKILMPKYFVHLYLDVVTRVVIAMGVDAAGFLEQALHLIEASIEPDEVTGHPAFPDVRERAQFVLVAEDDVVLPTGEEGRVNVDQVNALGGQLAHDVQVVAPEEAIRFKRRMAELHPVNHLKR